MADLPPNIPPPPPRVAPAWKEGYAARLHGVDRDSNPYLEVDDDREDQWDDGWLFADVEITPANVSPGSFLKSG